MRKILRYKTTYIDRDNTNSKIYKDINDIVKEQGNKKPIVTFREAYKKARRKNLIETIYNPLGIHYKVPFQRELRDWIYANRRRGAPKHTWARKALENLWEEVRNREATWRTTALNLHRNEIREKIKEYAKEEQEKLTKKDNYPGGENWGINRELEPEETTIRTEDTADCKGKRERVGAPLMKDAKEHSRTRKNRACTTHGKRETTVGETMPEETQAARKQIRTCQKWYGRDRTRPRRQVVAGWVGTGDGSGGRALLPSGREPPPQTPLPSHPPKLAALDRQADWTRSV